MKKYKIPLDIAEFMLTRYKPYFQLKSPIIGFNSDTVKYVGYNCMTTLVLKLSAPKVFNKTISKKKNDLYPQLPDNLYCNEIVIPTNIYNDDKNQNLLDNVHITFQNKLMNNAGYFVPLSAIKGMYTKQKRHELAEQLLFNASKYTKIKKKPKKKKKISFSVGDEVILYKTGKLRGDKYNWINKLGLSKGSKYIISNKHPNDLVSLKGYERTALSIFHFKKV